MNHGVKTIGGYDIPIVRKNTIVVGSGAAGLNAACRVARYGQRDIALVTEHMNAGTSRNTGSDKQTYYKLTLSGGDGDSVREMAETLYAGQCMDGDTALCEAALSAQGFLNLVELGVEFPRNRYGEFIGYKTDHDPRRRATSVGPYTSRKMTEALETELKNLQIETFTHHQIIKILKKENRVVGLLCLDVAPNETDRAKFQLFLCNNVIFATGGPAVMYEDSVFPKGHYGATGTALEAGIAGQNLTEWQYGLASVRPRWNVSGTYMQVLPRFVSTNADGTDEKEFLKDFFADKGEMLSKVFLKGYQWPFDVRKVEDGSSIIDLLVSIEKSKGRKVYLDFLSNPYNEDLDFSTLSQEAYTYLEQAGALFGTPIQRLEHMNHPAVTFYQDRGIDLSTEMLEVSLSAQHNNGGLAVDLWWQTNLSGFFAAGEVSGTHGVYRPGGSALNSGQVGSTRAAQYIAQNCRGDAPTLAEVEESIQQDLEDVLAILTETKAEETTLYALWERGTKRMSQFGAAIRDREQIQLAITEIESELENFNQLVRYQTMGDLRRVFRLKDMLIAQYVYLSAMDDYAKQGKGSRGSALYTDLLHGKKPYDTLPDRFTFTLATAAENSKIQQVAYRDGRCHFTWRAPREIPEDDDFFENVWREYRENKNIY